MSAHRPHRGRLPRPVPRARPTVAPPPRGRRHPLGRSLGPFAARSWRTPQAAAALAALERHLGSTSRPAGARGALPERRGSRGWRDGGRRLEVEFELRGAAKCGAAAAAVRALVLLRLDGADGLAVVVGAGRRLDGDAAVGDADEGGDDVVVLEVRVLGACARKRRPSAATRARADAAEARWVKALKQGIMTAYMRVKQSAVQRNA